MRRHGFTLVELLVVISIIVVLAGLLIPMIGYARNSAKAAKCETQMAGIKAGISRYVDVNGTIPDKQPGSASDVFATTFKPGSTYATADQLTSSDWTAIAQALLAMLQTVDRDNFRDLSALRDPFTGGAQATNVFRYRPAKFYPLLAYDPGKLPYDPKDKPPRTNYLWIDSMSENSADLSLPPNPDSYQLWSTGLDGKDQFGQRVDGRKSDDITNWKQP